MDHSATLKTFMKKAAATRFSAETVFLSVRTDSDLI